MSRAGAFLAVSAACLAAVPARADSPVRTVRVLVQNIYGRKEADCEARYRALAAQILAADPPFDVIAFNEHWRVPGDRWVTCDAEVLTKALTADGRYSGGGRSIRHVPRTDDALQVPGGDSIFTLHRITDSYENKFTNSNSFPLSGYVLARIEVAPGVKLDFWDAHLEATGGDHCDDECRLEQMTDFAGAVEIMSGVADDGERGHPVLVVGDFNIGGPLTASEKPPHAGNPGYEDLMDVFHHPRDMWLEAGPKDGTGYSYDCAENHAQECTERERIDYVLLPESPRILRKDSDYELVPKSIRLVKWTTPSGGNVSDHFGLDATLEIRRRAPAAAPPPPPVSSPAPLGLQGLLERPIDFDGR